MIIHKTVALLIERDGKILLLHRAQGQSDAGKWALPGGHAEERESMNLAARRELEEEVGEVEDLEQIGRPFVHDVVGPRSGPHQHICHVFRATLRGEPRVDTKEADDWAWFRHEDIRRLDLAGYTRTILNTLYPRIAK